MITKFVSHTTDGTTVSELIDMNRKLGGKNYLDMISGDIVSIEDNPKGESVTEIISEETLDTPKPKEKKSKKK